MLVALDIETTGLKKKTDAILEVALLELHPETLKVRVEAQTLVEHFSLPYMVPTVREMHEQSGLLDNLKNASQYGYLSVVGHKELDLWLAETFHALGATPGSILLMGMSIQFDRGFLEEKCPLACAFLSHRMIDLSTIRELLRLWAPLGAPQLPKVDVAHRAMQDSHMAVDTLRWYQASVFKVGLSSGVAALRGV